MSTLTAPQRPAPDTGNKRGPVRVLLRQHRKALWGAGALVVAGIGVMVALQVWVASGKERCPDGDTTRCGDGSYLPTYARTSTEQYLSDGGMVLLVLAGLIGAFVAGPLIARELESGTFRMAWTQSVSPAQWLAARLAVPAAVAIVGLTILSLVYRWGWTIIHSKPLTSLPWHGTGVYPGLGPVAVAFALLAVAVGALCAVLVRRTLLSMSATVLVLGVVMLGLSKRRYELWPTVQLLGDDIRLYASGWHIESGMLTASGEKLYWSSCFGGPDFRDPEVCMRERGGVTKFAEFHPDSHFWPLQLMETGILLALAAIAVALAFRALRRLHG
ncbi:ABC transporter permease [Streptomyces finlayi]|uniref:ABC transporter permease n=1 Tax=Streptomyces finlayi TaxID=67296 RepID=A0A7G7BKR8_9ACTN|nr:ABC transporter permease [Streptomyces finlayi]QNE75933.1 ABC transporter permease [Streptomyces finlayi]